MKKYIAIFTGSPTSPQGQRWQALDETTRNARIAEGMKAWHGWHAAHAGVVVEDGGPFSKTKRVTADGIADISNQLSGYTVVQAESHDAAARLFENHPHFSIFPGDGVEIMEIMPIPGM